MKQLMHDLKTLQRLLHHNGVEIKSFDGASLTTVKGDVWGLAHDVFYKNSEPVSNKQLREMFPKKIA